MAFTSIDNPELYFQVKIYTGYCSSRSITLDGSEDMEPNFVWVKSRSTTHQPVLSDSVRGTSKELRSDTSDAESSLGNINEFNKNDF